MKAQNLKVPAQTFNFGQLFAQQVADKTDYQNQVINAVCLMANLTFEDACRFIEANENEYTLNSAMGMSASDNAYDLINVLTEV